MKLYVINPENGGKTYLNRSCSTRRELAIQLGGNAFNVDGKYYSVNDVLAEKSSDSTAIGLVIGGALGLIGGTPGVLLGSAIGGALGNGNDSEEKKKVEIFNRSGA
jgi:hypothetical protein